MGPGMVPAFSQGKRVTQGRGNHDLYEASLSNAWDHQGFRDWWAVLLYDGTSRQVWGSPKTPVLQLVGHEILDKSSFEPLFAQV